MNTSSSGPERINEPLYGRRGKQAGVLTHKWANGTYSAKDNKGGVHTGSRSYLERKFRNMFEDTMDNQAIVNAILMQDKEGFMNSFKQVMATKVSDNLELEKIKLASNIFNTETASDDEPKGNETEADGNVGDAA